MRRWLILTLILTVLLTASGCDMQESGESTETSGVSAEAVDETELGELLTSIAELYESGYNGIAGTIDESNAYYPAKDYLREIGAIDPIYAPTDGERSQIRLLTEALTGVKYDEEEKFNHSYSTEGLSISQKGLAVEGTTARLTIERDLYGVKLVDAIYIFEQADPPVGWEGTVVEDFVLDGKVWHLIGVEFAERPAVSETTIEIASPEDLITWMEKVNSWDPEAVTGTVQLTADLDMAGYEMKPIGMSIPTVWQENDVSEYRKDQAVVPGGFNGIFEGNGHTISGVMIETDGAEAGFFGVLSSKAVVRDLNIEGDITSYPNAETYSQVVGGFVGCSEHGVEMTNCSFTGTVSGEGCVGGFAGRLESNNVEEEPQVRITNCSSNAQITGSYSVGGFAGSAGQPLMDCNAEGSITIEVIPGQAYPNGIGGFVGAQYWTITGCHSGVEIFYEVPGANRMGSFVGEAAGFGPETVAITDCTIDEDAVHEGWYLVGYKVYSTMPVDIDVIEE